MSVNMIAANLRCSLSALIDKLQSLDVEWKQESSHYMA